LLYYLKFTHKKLKEDSGDHCQVLPAVTLTADREKTHLLFQLFMTRSENYILKGQVVTMSLFRLTFFKAHWLVTMLAVAAVDDAYVQETIVKEERLNFKNATLQTHYGRTAGVSSSNCCLYWCFNSGPGSSVGIATGYELDGPVIESRWGRDLPYLSRLALGPTQPPVQWIPGLSGG
jgi:hypothetical protein